MSDVLLKRSKHAVIVEGSSLYSCLISVEKDLYLFLVLSCMYNRTGGLTGGIIGTNFGVVESLHVSTNFSVGSTSFRRVFQTSLGVHYVTLGDDI